jgi:ribonuclease HI
MELQAVIGALEALTRPCEVLIVSDSQYVVKGTGSWNDGKSVNPTGWMVDWKKRGWRRKEGKLINDDLWRKLHGLVIKQKSVRMRWVKGHAGNEYNERCDQLACEQRLRFR